MRQIIRGNLTDKNKNVWPNTQKKNKDSIATPSKN